MICPTDCKIEYHSRRVNFSDNRMIKMVIVTWISFEDVEIMYFGFMTALYILSGYYTEGYLMKCLILHRLLSVDPINFFF